MSQISFPNLSFLNPGQGPLRPANPTITGPQGQINWQPNNSTMPSSPGFGGQSPIAFNQPGGTNNPTMLDQAWLSFLNDYHRMQPAADAQYNRADAAIGQIGQTADSYAGQIRGTADQTSNDLGALVSSFGQSGAQTAHGLDQFADSVDQFARQGNPQMDASIQGAYGKADQAESGFQQGIRNFQDRGASDASSVSAGIQANAASEMQRIKAGIRPDGSPMTPQEQQEQLYKVKLDTQQQVADHITAIYSSVNTQMVGLQAQLASLREQGAQTRITGAGLYGQERSTQMQGEQIAGNIHTASAQVQQQNRELMGQIGQVMAQLKNAGVLNAANLAVNGREAMAQFIQNNPHSIISLFSGLTAMLSLASAPGVGGIGAATVPGPGQGGRP